MIDWTKPIQTNEKRPRPIRLLCDNLKCTDGHCFVVAVPCETSPEDEFITRANINGESFREFIVVNVPERHVRYENMYLTAGNRTRKEADENAGGKRIACVRVEFTEGQFDE